MLSHISLRVMKELYWLPVIHHLQRHYQARAGAKQAAGGQDHLRHHTPGAGSRAANEDPRSFHNLCCSRRTTQWTVWADWRRRGTPTHTTTDTAATRPSTRTTSENMVQRCYKQWCEWGDVDWLDRRCMMYQSKSPHTRTQVIYDDGDHYLSIISCYPFSRWTLDTAMIYGWRGNSLQLNV